MIRRQLPDGLDADTSLRIQRTFLVVRIVRGTLLLLFLVVAVVAVVLRGWPSVIAIAVAVAALLQAGAVVGWCRRCARTDTRPGKGMRASR